MNRLLALCFKEWRLLSRDKHGLAVMFLVPTLFILIMSVALKDAFSVEARILVPIKLVDSDGGKLARALHTELGSMPLLRMDTDAETVVTILKGYSYFLATRLDAVDELLLAAPTALSAQSTAAALKEPALLQVEFAPSTPPQLRLATSMLIRRALLSTQAEYLSAELSEDSDTSAGALRYINNPDTLPITEQFTGGQIPNAAQQAVPAWLIFSLFFSVIPLASAFVTERTQGTLFRLRAMGVSSTLIVIGKWIPYHVINLMQMLAMLAVGVWLVPLVGGDRLALGQSPAGLWLISTATSICALGFALLVASLVRTTTQATLAGGAISLLLAALGGVMVPKLVMPPAMQVWTQLSPMSWALEGYWDIFLRNGGVAAVLPEAAALTLLGCTLLALAAYFLHSTIHKNS